MTALEETAPGAPGAATLERVAAILERRTGMRVQSAQRVRLERAVARRMEDLDGVGAADYAARVEQDPEEVCRLVPDVAVGETRFFRDRERWITIEHHVLPDLIARHGHRPLQLWSAGCATGQEAFGLAMVCHRMRDHYPALQAEVLGSDINPDALAVARRGEYPKEVMHGIGPSDQARFFEAVPGGFRVRPEVRAEVRFETLNLLEWAEGPHPGPAYDLILCQRVLIYLSPAATERILTALAAALAPDGMLLVGHTESVTSPAGCVHEWIGPSHGFRRREPAPEAEEADEDEDASEAPRLLARAWEAAIAERYGEVEALLKDVPATKGGLWLAAWVALCRGDRTGAEARVREALAEAPTEAEPHLLAGLLALGGETPRAAATHLRRAVYLDPDCAPALFHLAALATAAGRDREARRAWRSAEAASAADVERIRRYFGFDAEAFAEVCRGHLSGGETSGA